MVLQHVHVDLEHEMNKNVPARRKLDYYTQHH